MLITYYSLLITIFLYSMLYTFFIIGGDFMLNKNRKLSKKGFSLIELMVAVIILAIAVLGIFLAFSNAWMGMANARDRTVATNYAREAMEDVKNMDFEMITNENLGMAESVGAKYTRVIIVNTESDNLKKINTRVFWTNRQGQYVSVEPSMYINRTIFNPGAATHLNLYADPYYTVLPSAGTSNIIAVIKDSNGNTKIDWDGGDIQFTVLGSGYSDFDKGAIGSDLGYLGSGFDDISVTTNEGRAEVIFAASGFEISEGVPAQGEVVIEASVDLPNGGPTISDTITITITLDVVRIELLANPDSIDADGISISTVTAALVNSGGVTVEDAPNDITFNISGEGIFVDSGGTPLGSTTVPMTPSEGTATIYVQSILDTPGIATVTATSEGLLSDTVNIVTTGDATSISVSVDPDLIYIDDTDGATVTVEIQDVNGNPIEFTGAINIATSDGTGNFIPNILNFAGTSSASTTFSSASIGIVTITASGGGLTDGSVIIEVKAPLIADTISLSAIPKNILAGGMGVSEITATIKQGSTVIANYSNSITFKIVTDTSNLHDALLSFNSNTYPTNIPLTIDGVDYGSDGKVEEVYLTPASNVGICTIEVSTTNSSGTLINNTVQVGFYSSEHHIKLNAVPSKMLVNGDNCTVTATVVDEGGTPINTYNEDVTFTILVGWPKNAKFAATGTSSLTTTMVNGEISVGLIPQKEAGTVTLKASSFTGMTNISGYLNIPVVTTLLELAPIPNIIYEGNQVSFDIEVQGAGINLAEMQILWSPDDSETLNKIEINPNSTGNPVIYPD
ncbi:MAG TPA: prepilin-type N-terminal cleavage/methylation domain-containing protein, partial [Candidatus Atribacteria bacterium]|nr:prepilin-type N-terminal cleavage/methylation domain-containing protein [Candidatus Atribacteria bacterium]